MEKLIIDLSGRGGLSKKFYGDIDGSGSNPHLRYLAKNGQLVAGKFNASRKYGFMSPNNTHFGTLSGADASGSVLSNRWTTTLYDPDTQETYVGESNDITATGYAWKANPGNPNANFDTLSDLGISTAAGSEFTDIEIYQLNGVKTVFFSYINSLGGDILQYTSASTIAPQWFVVNTNVELSGSTHMFMRTADNGFMYIFDVNKIHKVDGSAAGGATGTITMSVMEFPGQITITDAIDLRGSLWVAIQSSTPTGFGGGTNYTVPSLSNICGIYIWDRKSTVSGTSNFISISGVRDIRRLYTTEGGELRMITISSDGFTQIRRYNGNTFEVMVELGIKAYPVFKDSVAVTGQFVTWLGRDGIIYSHGRLVEGEPEGLYIIGDITSETGTNPSPGAIMMIGTGGYLGVEKEIWFCSEDSTQSAIYPRKFSPNLEGYAPNIGDVYTPVKLIPKLSTVSTIDVFCAPTTNTGTTETATISVYTNMSTTPFKVHSVTKDQTTRGYIRIPIDKPFVNSVQLKISWNPSVVIGDDTFLPMYAEVDYTPTKTAA